MMLKTHLAIAVFVILLFMPSVSHPWIFALVALIASFIPDIDTGFSTVGRSMGGAIIRFFTKHRGFFHSFSFCVIASLVLAFFLPIAALPFFLGYSLHLLTDSFTLEGIRPFWPFRKESKGFFKTSGFTEMIVFIVVLVLDIILFLFLFDRIF